ncbi:MAG: hypothetical protein JNL18_14490 [Planctomycetaceae bacterium]|nr:hypothetical protein [Planctomycetaceae bacterium]
MISLLQSIISIPVPFNMVTIAVLAGSTAGICGSLFMQIRKFACHRAELNFKRDLLDRGLTADEVEQIVQAHGSANDALATASSKMGCTTR